MLPVDASLAMLPLESCRFNVPVMGFFGGRTRDEAVDDEATEDEADEGLVGLLLSEDVDFV